MKADRRRSVVLACFKGTVVIVKNAVGRDAIHDIQNDTGNLLLNVGLTPNISTLSPVWQSRGSCRLSGRSATLGLCGVLGVSWL